MKKKLITTMILLGALGAPTMVSAETVLKEIGTVENADWIYNTNLLKVNTSTGYAVQSVDGTVLTEGIYRNFDSSCGYLIADKNESGLAYEGVLTKDGAQLIPCDYADIKVLNKNWILGIKLEESTADVYDYESWLSDDAYYLITSVDVYVVKDNTAACVATLPRENYLDAEAFGEYINIQDRSTNAITTYDLSYTQVAADLSSVWDKPAVAERYEIFEENGQEGIKDAEGNVILEPSYEYIYETSHGYFEVSTGDKEGLVDEAGNVVVPAEYDAVYTSYRGAYNEEYDTTTVYSALGYYTVDVGGKIGFVDSKGQLVSEPKYAREAMEYNGVSGIVTDVTGSQILVAADGTETILEGYDSVYAMDAGYGMYYRVRNAEGKEGMIDWHGEEVLPCIYNDVSMSHDGNYILITEDYMNFVIYEVNSDFTSSETEAAGEEDATETPEAAAKTVEEGGAVEESEAIEKPEVSDASGISAVLDSAVSILASDSAGNREAAISIIQTAAGKLGEDQAAAAVILENVVEQLETEGSDINSILTLIESVKSLL